MHHVIGAAVAGRYELLEPIGSGGNGTVFRSRDNTLDRTVAVKLLRPSHDDTARARLRAEAVIASRLAHPCLAGVLDYGEEHLDGEAAPYVVMEYVEGATLHEALKDGPLPPQRVARIVADVADALAHAHGLGVVHRDVKPANIMLRADGRAVLLDFGIAHVADLEPLTLTGTIVGTVNYLSPEQARGTGATPRSDLYALGLVAYEALTGERPLTRDTEVATLLAHASEDMPPLPARVPADLRRLVDQMARREPADRPRDAAEVATRAREATTHRSTRVGALVPPFPPPATRPMSTVDVPTAAMAAPVAGVTVPLTAPVRPATATWARRTSLAGRVRSRTAAVAAAVLAAACVAVVAGLLISRAGGNGTPQASMLAAGEGTTSPTASAGSPHPQQVIRATQFQLAAVERQPSRVTPPHPHPGPHHPAHPKPHAGPKPHPGAGPKAHGGPPAAGHPAKAKGPAKAPGKP